MSFLLHGCGNNTLSDNEIEKAISEGVLSVEDAYERDLIDDEQFEMYSNEREATSIPAVNKKLSNKIGAFESTTMKGEPFTNDNLNEVTYFAFINPNAETGQKAYEVIENNYDSIIENGGDVLIVSIGIDELGLMNDSEITIIEYNESIIEALGDLTEMINLDGFSGAWNGSGAFLSAWHLKINEESLLETMTSILDLM